MIGGANGGGDAGQFDGHPCCSKLCSSALPPRLSFLGIRKVDP